MSKVKAGNPHQLHKFDANSLVEDYIEDCYPYKVPPTDLIFSQFFFSNEVRHKEISVSDNHYRELIIKIIRYGHNYGATGIKFKSPITITNNDGFIKVSFDIAFFNEIQQVSKDDVLFSDGWHELWPHSGMEKRL